MFPLLAAAAALHLDAAKSSLTIHVFKTGLASPALHDHDFVPDTWSAKATFDKDDVASSSLRLTIDAASLHDTNAELSASDEKKVDAEAHTTVLDVAHFPTITVSTDHFIATTSSGGSWTGTLPASITLHGVSKDVAIPTTLTWSAAGGGTLHATGAIDVKQSDFGIKPFSKALGTIKIKDGLRVRFDVTAVPDP